jgi:transposase
VVTPSACEIHREWIESQVTLGRNAVSLYQDLVEKFGFTHQYNSVKRFVAKLKAREPERFDVLDALPGEEAQVDFGQGAPTRLRNGRHRKPYLFVMTLKYSGKSFRKVVWKADQETWARLHEEAFLAFGGSVTYVVLDNLKQGVIKPDLYLPEYNTLYAAMLAHYGAAADACRPADPDRKACVSYCLLSGTLRSDCRASCFALSDRACLHGIVQAAASAITVANQQTGPTHLVNHSGGYTETLPQFFTG